MKSAGQSCCAGSFFVSGVSIAPRAMEMEAMFTSGESSSCLIKAVSWDKTVCCVITQGVACSAVAPMYYSSCNSALAGMALVELLAILLILVQAGTKRTQSIQTAW